MPVITGMRERNRASATGSVLKAQRSSREPPPRTRAMTSAQASAFTASRAATISAGALSPCTSTGYTRISQPNPRSEAMRRKSRTAAPLGEVIRATRSGLRGRTILRSSSK